MKKNFDRFDVINNPFNSHIRAKNKFARLIASENIVIDYEYTNTPSFDIKNRVLTLPIWSNYTESLLDRLIGHEVSHAVFTPQTEFMQLVETMEKNEKEQLHIFLSFVNIVEDIRIEKHIIRKYPGILPQFVESCTDLMDRDYFGLTKYNKDPSQMNIADRINLFFKINQYDDIVPIKFNDKEQEMVDELSTVETWNDTLIMAKKLMEFCKNEQPEMFDKAFYNLDEGEGDEKGKEGDQAGKEANGKKIILIITQHEWDKNKKANTKKAIDAKALKRLQDEGAKIISIDMPGSEYNPQGFIIPVHEVVEGYSFGSGPSSDISWETFRNNVKVFLSSMIMEFQRRKRASIWLTKQRNTTGDLDLNNIFKYQISDEIFKSEIKFKKGKNHSIVMFIDYSGSMTETLGNVIKQVYLMILFCRILGIKHSVYGFNDNSVKTKNMSNQLPIPGHRNSFGVSSNFKLVELFHHNQSQNQFEEQAANLYGITNNSSRSGRNKYLTLHGTPLNDTLLLSHKLLARIKDENKSDILNAIFLTDGDSNGLHYFSAGKIDQIRHSEYMLNSGLSGRSIYGNDCSPYGVTLALVDMLRQDLNINVINFHILDGYSIDHVLSRAVIDKTLVNQAIATFNTEGKVGIFNDKVKAWSGIIFSKDSMLDITTSNAGSTKQILQLVVNLVS